MPEPTSTARNILWLSTILFSLANWSILDRYAWLFWVNFFISIACWSNLSVFCFDERTILSMVPRSERPSLRLQSSFSGFGYWAPVTYARPFFDILMEVKVDKKEWSAQTKLEPIVFILSPQRSSRKWIQSEMSLAGERQWFLLGGMKN